ncbi:MAG: hypothetical protein JO097_08710, partial [Acidobacteriaceae bacterium]|nr:hypothetical protein [Acidobacteriaceae bacterium]
DITTGDLTGDVITSGTTATILATINSGPGQCGDATHVCQVTTDAKGRVTAQTTFPISAVAAWGSITGTLSNQTDLENALNAKQAAGNYVTGLSGDVSASGPGSAPATLATVNSGPGQCGDATHVCQVTTDAKGRITAQAPVTISAGGSGTVTHTTGALTAGQLIIGNGSGDITTGNLTGDVITSGTTATILATINSGPGQCGDATHVCQVTTDAKGRVTAQTTIPVSAVATWGSITGTLSSQTDLENALNAKQAAGNYVTGLTGDVTASGPGSAPATLASVNSGPGQCGDATHVCQVTTDAKGRVTAQTTLPISAAATWGSITGTLSNQTDLESALNAKQAAGNYMTALTGDVSASGPGSAPATLATVNSGPGQCGDATHVCQVTTDAKGRVTAQAPVTITAGGTGTVTHTAGALTAGQLIFGNGGGDIRTGDLTGDVSTNGTAATTLASVNGSAGPCGDATHVCQVTTDAKGRVTAQTAVAIAGGSGNASSIQGIPVSSTAPTNSQVLQYQTASNSYVPVTISGGGSSNWASGTLASIPGTCTPGSGLYLYFATDQPAGQQEYQCSSANTWTQLINLGGSGALQITGGSLDINPAVVSRQAASETLGFKTFALGLSLLTTNTQPACTSANRGTFWYLNNGSAKDNVQVCVWNGSAFAWISLY